MDHSNGTINDAMRPKPRSGGCEHVPLIRHPPGWKWLAAVVTVSLSLWWLVIWVIMRVMALGS